MGSQRSHARSQNNRALRSNPNANYGPAFTEGIFCHKITEPYAQIPTEFSRFLSSNLGKSHKITEPYAQIPTYGIDDEGENYEPMCHKITEPYAQIPTEGEAFCREMADRCHKITEPYAQIPT